MAKKPTLPKLSGQKQAKLQQPKTKKRKKPQLEPAKKLRQPSRLPSGKKSKSTSTYTPHPLTKEDRSRIGKERWQNLSEEQRQKILLNLQKGRTGRKWTEEQKQQARERAKQYWTKERRQQASEAAKKRWEQLTELEKQKILSNLRKGQEKSEGKKKKVPKPKPIEEPVAPEEPEATPPEPEEPEPPLPEEPEPEPTVNRPGLPTIDEVVIPNVMDSLLSVTDETGAYEYIRHMFKQLDEGMADFASAADWRREFHTRNIERLGVLFSEMINAEGIDLAKLSETLESVAIELNQEIRVIIYDSDPKRVDAAFHDLLNVIELAVHMAKTGETTPNFREKATVADMKWKEEVRTGRPIGIYTPSEGYDYDTGIISTDWD